MAREPMVARGGVAGWKARDGVRAGVSGGGGDPELPPLFPGHIAFRCLIGFNSPDDQVNTSNPPRPQYTEASGFLPGGPGYCRRMFSSGWYTRTKLVDMITKCEAGNQLPVLSFKVPSDAWDVVAGGGYDTDLLDLVNYAVSKRVANGGNGKPFLIAFHHEPNSNGPAGLTLLEQLTWWGKMQEHCLDYISGQIPGQPVDVSDIVVWAPIANGFWWGTRNYYPDRIAAAYPPSLIAKMNAKGGPLMCDVYDPNPLTWSRNAAGDRDESTYTFQTNYDRAWRNAQGMITWARANGVKAVGFGEFGIVPTANFDELTNVLMDNRDIVALAMMFSNFTNSTWDYRAIPADYPPYNGTNSRGLVDVGGDAVSAVYISKFEVLRARSVAETNPF